MACPRETAVLGYGVLWWTGRRAWHEGVPSQDAALVFQGVLPGAVSDTDCCHLCWSIPIDAIKVQIIELVRKMKANKKAIIWTTAITVACLIICIVLHDSHTLIYDLSLACFGSALLGIVVATTAYLAERRDAMERFGEEVRKAIAVIGSIPVVEISDLVVGALKDENNWLEKTTTNQDKLKEHIEARLPVDENTSVNQVNEWIENTYQSTIEDARKRLRKGAAAYIAVAEYDLTGLHFAYGRLDFLIGNKIIRKHAYQNLYNKIRDFKGSCINESRAFKPYIAGHGNEMVCIDKIVSLQNQIFENRDGIYYAKMRDELLHSLETLRSQTYNIMPEYEEPFPLHYCIDFEDPESVERYKRYMKKVNQEGRDEQTLTNSMLSR